MNRFLIAFAVVALYLLHQDYWYWYSVEPLVFGILPIGLFYHAVYSLVAVGFMLLLVRFAWPEHLESQADDTDRASAQESEH